MEILAKDKRGRPLVILRENGMIVFHRYEDLDAADRKAVIDLHELLKNSPEFASGVDGDIEAFMDFRDEGSSNMCG